MTNNARVLNVTRRFSLKHKQALRAVENCAAAWVEYGISIRDLTLAESITLRNQQARAREPLAIAELHGIVYKPSERNTQQAASERRLAYEANKFFETATPQWVN